MYGIPPQEYSLAYNAKGKPVRVTPGFEGHIPAGWRIESVGSNPDPRHWALKRFPQDFKDDPANKLLPPVFDYWLKHPEVSIATAIRHVLEKKE